jgi:hypothetical protein
MINIINPMKKERKLQSQTIGNILYCLCFLLVTIYLPAQNTGSHRYTTLQQDSCGMFNMDVIEIDDYYYLLTDVMCRNANFDRIPTVTVFDSHLNIVKNIELFGGNKKIMPVKLFYSNHFIYLAGLNSEVLHSKPFFMKFDKDFNIVQSPVIYMLDDSLSYGCIDVIMNSNNEFAYMLLINNNDHPGRLLLVDTNGIILQNIFFTNQNILGTIVETENNYYMDMGRDYLLKFHKDSLDKVDSLPINVNEDDTPEGTLIIVGNHFIRSNRLYTFRDECGEYPPLETDRSIVFLDTNMQEINRLEFGKPCASDLNGYRNMNYRNVDSIYYAYSSLVQAQSGHVGSTLSIANFSSSGYLNFNHTLNIPEDSLLKTVYGCKAISDGGVLVFGISEFATGGWYHPEGFLLKYHPQKNDLTVKEFPLDLSIKVYPNPAQSQFTVTNAQNAELRLYNILGQEVLHIHNEKESVIIPVGRLPQGLYVLKIEKKNAVFTRKIQIN